MERWALYVRRDARADESARLESVCGATHRGFESHSLRSAGGRSLGAWLSLWHRSAKRTRFAFHGPSFARSPTQSRPGSPTLPAPPPGSTEAVSMASFAVHRE